MKPVLYTATSVGANREAGGGGDYNHTIAHQIYGGCMLTIVPTNVAQAEHAVPLLARYG